MQSTVRRKSLIACLVLAGACALAHADATLKTMSPLGEVGLVRQVRATFGESMVKFGDPRLPAPLDVACKPDAAPAGTGRWVDDKTWVFDFARDLPPGTVCKVAPHPGIKSIAGAAIAANAKFDFSTGGPAVVRAYPSGGGQIEEEQVFALLLNGAATADSIQRFAYCEVAGVGERLAVKVITGATRDAILKAVDLVPQQARSVTLQCARPIAPESKVSLVWGKGIATTSGVASTVDRTLHYAVRPAFTASFTCGRVNARADCLPMRPLRVEFSSPVPRRIAEKVVLVGPDGKHKPQFELHRGETSDALVDLHESGLHKFLYFFGRDKGSVDATPSEEGVTAVQFSDTLPERADLRIELPADFADDSGRKLDNAAQFPLATRTSDAPPLARFPAATFGILELDAEPVLPLTVRKIEGALGVKAVSLGGAPARDLTLTDDASIIEWFARVARYDETSLDRATVEQELGIKLPPPPVKAKPARKASDHGRARTQEEQDEDANEGDVNAQDPNAVQTRTVSLLNKAANVRAVRLPPESQTEPHPFEVIGIPLPQPGYHVVEIESPRLGEALLDRKAPMYVRTGVLVTNLGVHFKWAPVNSGAWVTTLDKGQPVQGAAVQVSDCQGNKVWSGQTDAQGFARIEQALPRLEWNYCSGQRNGRWSGQSGRPDGYFVSARKTDAKGRADLAFVWSTWQEGIEAWRFNLNSSGGAGDVSRELFHTVMDRTLLRAGQTVSMKSHARRELLTGLGMIDAKGLPTTLRITHEGSGDHVDFPLTWRAGRYAETVFKIPDDAKLGVYDVSLQSGESVAAQTGSFRVEEFRLPAMIGRLVPPAGPQVDPRALTLDVMVNYGNGGGAANLPLRVSAQVRDIDLSTAVPVLRYPGFHFDPPAAPGTPERSGDGAIFSEENVDEDDADRMVSQRDTNSKLVADKLPVTLDKSGAGKVTLSKLPPVTAPKELLVQATYADPNGELQTLSQTLPLWPSGVVLGVRTDDWVSVHQKLPAQVVALDTKGKPMAGVDVSVRAVIHRSLSARKRLVGGFYAYDNKSVDEDLGEVCTGKSDARGLVLCEATLAASGQVELIAQARDAQGHLARAASSVWVTRAGEVWFGSANDDRMDVLPEQRAYEPGQVAKFQVRSPFRHATALVSIERNGIIETRTVQLDGRDPTIELPVKAEWAPNVFVSVLAVRGRVREVPWYSLFTWGWKAPVAWWHAWRDGGDEVQAPTAMVDLAKPAFKFGITEIEVGIAAHRLKVDVVPDKATYPIRATSQVRIKVTLPDGRAAPAGTEVTLAAVDEALLSLRPNDSWDLLGAMIRRRDYAVETATAQMQIIGKRHFGKKAAPAGGGGGQFPTRELFDTLLLWNPSVVLDAKGEAVVPVPLNDSLTSFRIVAIADVVQGAQQALFGTGQATIAATQDLQIVSGVPPLVREGDRYKAMFTLRNSSTAAMTASMAASAGAQALPAQSVSIPAGTAVDVAWDVDAPFNVNGIAWMVAADAGAAHDRMKFAQKIVPAVPVTVQQATLVQLDKTLRIPIAPPANALADASGKLRGGVDVALKPRLGDGLPGVRDFFERYPWICFEQQASISIGLRDTGHWHALMNQAALYQDEDGLLNYFPSNLPRTGSDSLTAYVLAISDEATRLGYDFALPDDVKARMQRGLIGFVEGKVNRDFWRPAFLKNGDLDVRKLAALEALSRYGKVQPRLVDSIQVLPNQWPTGAVIDWLQVLDRVPAIPDRAKRMAEAEQVLRARLNVQGTRLAFSTERDDSWWWLMSNADVNSVRMTLAVLGRNGWADDVPRIVTGTLQRQQAGHWSTTVANAWGSVAMEAFSKTFETVPVRGVTRAGFGAPGVTSTLDWSKIPAGTALPLGWPAGFGVGGNKADATLQVDHDGSGKPWVTVTSRAAVPVTAPFGSGYRVTKTLTPVEQKVKGQWSRGDVVRVHLDIDVQADATWVVVNDPIPGGAAMLGTGLGNDDQISTGTEKDDSRGWLAYQERGFEAFRAYYRYLPKGAFSVEYTMRLNNPGRFGLPQTHVEAMYAPEMFGESPNAAFTVQP